MDTHFAADALLQVDLAPLLRTLHDATVNTAQLDAIDRTNFQACFAAGAVVGVNDRQFLRQFLARFCIHRRFSVFSTNLLFGQGRLLFGNQRRL